AGAGLSEYAVPLAEARARNGDLEAALELLDAVRPETWDAEYRAVRASVLVESGRLDEADAVLSAGLESPEPQVQVAVTEARARLALARGDVLTTEALVAEALQIDPESGELWVLSAAAALRSNALADAETRFERAAALFEERGQAGAAVPVLFQLVQA